ncbi:MAG: Clp protease N-terminal domain-containing protein, partial [Gammaproteobacteria bacterium]
MLSGELEYCLNEAFRRARDNRHEFMTVEHLLLSLLDVPSVSEVLRSCGADIDKLRSELRDFV